MKEQIGKVQLHIIAGDKISASAGPGAAKISGKAWSGDSVTGKEREEERELMEILKTCSVDRYRSVVQERGSEFLLEELSGLKANLVRAFAVPDGASALEAGCGCGAVTGALAEKCGEVVSWDPDAERCRINAYQNRERENVTMYAGDFRGFCNEIHLDYPGKKFDLITCIGPLQRASRFIPGDTPCRAIVQDLLSFLAQDGILLILVKEIREYRQLTEGSMLSGYRTMLYEISPDEMFPMEITGEQWLSEHHSGAEACGTEDGGRPALLLIQGAQRAADTLLYAKFSGERAGRYALYTAIYERYGGPRRGGTGTGEEPEPAEESVECGPQSGEMYAGEVQGLADQSGESGPQRAGTSTDEGQRYVEKRALTKAAVPHVSRISELSGRLSEMYRGRLKINRCVKTNITGAVRMEYLTGETFEEYLDRILAKQGPDACGKALLEYLDLVVPKELEITFEMTDSFRETFGEIPGEIYGEISGEYGIHSLKTLPVSDVDLIPANVIRSGGDCTLIDYEWSFDFPVPSDFLRYRILFYYLRPENDRQRLAQSGIWQKAGLTGQKRKIFASMEDSFQRWLTRDNTPVRDLRAGISSGAAHTGDGDRRLRVYYPARDGSENYSELRSSDYRMRDGKLSADLEVPPGMTGIRLDPGDLPGILRVRSLTIDGRLPELVRTNGLPVYRESEAGEEQTGPVPSVRPVYLSAIYFDSEDPNFTIRWNEENSSGKRCQTVSVDFSFTEMDGDLIRPLMDLQRQRELSASSKHHRNGGILHRLTGRKD